MYPYLLVYTYIITIVIYENKFKKDNHKIFIRKILSFEFGFIALFLFAAFRGNGNGDYYNYLNGVRFVKNIEFIFNPVNYPFEIGFRVLSYISNVLKLRPQFVLISMNTISFICMYIFINKRSRNKSLSLFLLFPIVLYFDMHHSRNAVAMSAGLLFFDALIDERYFKGLLFLLLAYSFHRSAMVLLALVPLILIRNNKEYLNKTKLLFRKHRVLIFLLLMLVLFINPMKIALTLLNNPLTANFYVKLNSYLLNDRWSYPFRLYDPRILILVLIYFYSETIKLDERSLNTYLLDVLLISITFIVLLRSSTIITIRLYNYFNIFSIVLIPNLIMETNYKKKFMILNRNIITYTRYIIILYYFTYTVIMISKQFEYYTYF